MSKVGNIDTLAEGKSLCIFFQDYYTRAAIAGTTGVN